MREGFQERKCDSGVSYGEDDARSFLPSVNYRGFMNFLFTLVKGGHQRLLFSPLNGACSLLSQFFSGSHIRIFFPLFYLLPFSSSSQIKLSMRRILSESHPMPDLRCLIRNEFLRSKIIITWKKGGIHFRSLFHSFWWMNRLFCSLIFCLLYLVTGDLTCDMWLERTHPAFHLLFSSFFRLMMFCMTVILII